MLLLTEYAGDMPEALAVLEWRTSHCKTRVSSQVKNQHAIASMLHVCV